MATNSTADVSNPSSTYLEMRKKWDLIIALLGGTAGMREAGRKFLPQYENETDKSFSDRLARSNLFNVFGETVNTLASKPFAQEIKVADGLPEPLKPILDDADKQGNDLTAWAFGVFKDGLAKGFTAVMVDMPEADPNIKTLADEQAAERRPYFCHIPAESIIAGYCELVDGQERITHLRVAETEVRRDGWKETIIRRVRVFEPGRFEVWEQPEGGKYEKVKQGETDLPYVPLEIWYCGDKLGFLHAQPPLMDLADKNLEHFQSASDQRNALTVARFPILAVAGAADLDGVTLGPRKLLASEDVGSKFYYVENEGKALAAGKADLDDLKEEMSALGLELLTKRSGGKTATATAIETAQSHCRLQRMAENFSDFMERLLGVAADWMKTEIDEEDVDVEIFTDFGIDDQATADLDILKAARATRDISRPAFLTELQRRNILSDTFDAEADAELLTAEGPALGSMRLPPGATPPGAAAKAGKPAPGSETGAGSAAAPVVGPGGGVYQANQGQNGAFGAQSNGASPNGAIEG